MAFPLIPVVIIILVFLAGSAAAVVLWPQLKGKRLLLTGATSSGKTTLSDFLATGVIPARYVRTTATTTKKPNGGVKLKDLSLKVDKIWDPPGDREAWGAWLGKAKQADVILYLIDYSRRHDDGYVQMVRRDTGQIAFWRKQGDLRKGTAIVLVVTHCDAQADFTPIGDAAQSEARQSAPAQQALRALGAGTPLVAGSLKTGDHAGALAFKILEALRGGERG